MFYEKKYIFAALPQEKTGTKNTFFFLTAKSLKCIITTKT